MLFAAAYSLLLSLPLLFSPSFAAPPTYPNALAAIDAQPDTKLIAALIKRDPELVTLYRSVKDVTIFLAIDSSFPTTDPAAPVFANIPFVRAVLQQIIIEGVHPTKSFTARPKYYKSKLTNPEYVNTSLGAAVGRLVKLAGKNDFRAAGGLSANVIPTGADIPFQGGLLQKIDAPINPPVSIPTTAGFDGLPPAPNYSILNASAFGLLDTIVNRKDVTLFALTNEAFNAAVKKFLNAKQCAPKSVLQYLEEYVIVDGVYYGDRFDGRKVKTLGRGSVTLSGVEKFPALRVNGAKVVLEDVFVTNGVVHVIDRPL